MLGDGRVTQPVHATPSRASFSRQPVRDLPSNPGRRLPGGVDLEYGPSSSHGLGRHYVERLGEHVLVTRLEIPPAGGFQSTTELDRLTAEDDHIANRQQMRQVTHHEVRPEHLGEASELAAEASKVDLDSLASFAPPSRPEGKVAHLDSRPIPDEESSDRRLPRPRRPGKSCPTTHGAFGNGPP